MPPLSTHSSLSTVKLLILGDSGSGKSGSLASLAEAGYNLRIADFDNGLDILVNLLRDKPEALARVHYKSYLDSFKGIKGRILPKQPLKAWPNFSKDLDSWEEFGPLSTWTPKEVFVIDSMNFMSLAAFRNVLVLNGRAGQAPWQSDYGEAQNMVETVLQFLYDDDIKCNVIITSHVQFLGPEGAEKGYATVIGKALSPKVGRYFNSIILARSKTQGSTTTRELITQPVDRIELKSSLPSAPRTYPLATGLASFFKDVTGSGNASTQKGT